MAARVALVLLALLAVGGRDVTSKSQISPMAGRARIFLRGDGADGRERPTDRRPSAASPDSASPRCGASRAHRRAPCRCHVLPGGNSVAAGTYACLSCTRIHVVREIDCAASWSSISWTSAANDQSATGSVTTDAARERAYRAADRAARREERAPTKTSTDQHRQRRDDTHDPPQHDHATALLPSP